MDKPGTISCAVDGRCRPVVSASSHSEASLVLANYALHRAEQKNGACERLLLNGDMVNCDDYDDDDYMEGLINFSCITTATMAMMTTT